MKKFIILFSVGLLLPAFCFGAVSYERTPSGYTISNPVSFEISFDNYSEVSATCATYMNYWGIWVERANAVFYRARTFPASTTKSYVFDDFYEGDLAIASDYRYVFFVCSNDPNPIGEEGVATGNMLETNAGATIFEVVEEEEEPTGGIFTLSTDFLASTTAYVGDIFGDIWVLVAFMIGFPLAFWVILKIENLIKKKDKTKFKRPKDLKEKNNWL